MDRRKRILDCYGCKWSFAVSWRRGIGACIFEDVFVEISLNSNSWKTSQPSHVCRLFAHWVYLTKLDPDCCKSLCIPVQTESDRQTTFVALRSPVGEIQHCKTLENNLPSEQCKQFLSIEHKSFESGGFVNHGGLQFTWWNVICGKDLRRNA